MSAHASVSKECNSLCNIIARYTIIHLRLASLVYLLVTLNLYFYSITLSNGHCANRSCINMALLTTKRVGKGELIGIISKGCMCYNCVLKGNKEKKNLADIFSFLILFG